MKLETVQKTRGKVTYLELSKDEALRLASNLILQVNAPYGSSGEEFKIDDGHYFKAYVDRNLESTREAIEYLAGVLHKLPDDEKRSVLADLASGNDYAIWQRYLDVKLDFQKAEITLKEKS